MIKLENKYEGFSLVEMIITIFILGIVMLITATTLTTLIKVSAVSEAKSVTRNDVDFVLEIVNRSLSNANLDYVRLYNTYVDENKSETVRAYNPLTNTIVFLDDTDAGAQTLASKYATQVDTGATEVHVRTYGYERWTCIGLFAGYGTDQWYILKTSVSSLAEDEHASCFGGNNDRYLIVLNSSDVNIKGFSLNRYTIEGKANTFLTVDLVAEPVNWPTGDMTLVGREVSKQITLSTQGLTWFY